MMKDNKIKKTKPSSKKPYIAPQLTVNGTFKEITKSTSSSSGDDLYIGSAG